MSTQSVRVVSASRSSQKTKSSPTQDELADLPEVWKARVRVSLFLKCVRFLFSMVHMLKISHYSKLTKVGIVKHLI